MSVGGDDGLRDGEACAAAGVNDYGGGRDVREEGGDLGDHAGGRVVDLAVL